VAKCRWSIDRLWVQPVVFIESFACPESFAQKARKGRDTIEFSLAAPNHAFLIMTKLLLFGVLLTVLAASPSLTLMANDEPKAAPKEKNPRKGRLQHVVSFKFKEAASKEQVKEIEEAFRALKTKIPQIEKLQWGLNNSPEGLNKGFTHCWILTFGSEGDRDAYLKHPDHVVFGKLLRPVLGDVLVVDFWSKD